MERPGPDRSGQPCMFCKTLCAVGVTDRSIQPCIFCKALYAVGVSFVFLVLGTKPGALCSIAKLYPKFWSIHEGHLVSALGKI